MKRIVYSIMVVLCLASLATGARAQNGDASGAWDVILNTPGGARNFRAVFKVDGDKLTGQYKGMLGESEVTGSVKGSQIEFSFKVSGQIEGTVVYSGTTDGATMKGKVNLGDAAVGTFTGKKK